VNESRTFSIVLIVSSLLHYGLIGPFQGYSKLLPTFLGAFAKLRKATISFVRSVRLSVRMEQLGSHWTDFLEN
jgi:hypothetical protein